MGSLPKKVFISYVQEDGAVAYEIAAGLESQGYSSWYYERDCPAGADYFEETHKAISDCEAMVIVISPRSLPSDQITREIVRAVESSKATFPLLLEVTHDDYAHRRPGWHQAMAAANATRIPPERVATVVPSLVAGLGAKGIQAHANGRWATAAASEANHCGPAGGFERSAIAEQSCGDCRQANDGRADSSDRNFATDRDDGDIGDGDDCREAATTVDDHWDRGCISCCGGSGLESFASSSHAATRARCDHRDGDDSLRQRPAQMHA